MLLWQKFLGRLPKVVGEAEGGVVTMTEVEMKELARWELNGREIKNVVKTVRTWCALKGVKMGLERLESGVLVTKPGAEKETI